MLRPTPCRSQRNTLKHFDYCWQAVQVVPQQLDPAKRFKPGLNGFVNEMCSLREMGFGPAEVDLNKGTVTSQTFFHDSVLRTIDIPCMDGSGEEEVLVTLWRVQGIYLKWMGGQ
ncbi:hypothetical protein ScalyP_jg7347 [Parmales sp. scaly parma]|nr:hypothetical protein ScalyP_jg7347 [Parmales sp. scaly parma]